MTDCAYCGHAEGMHAGPCRYDGAPAFPTGLRKCRCPKFQTEPADRFATNDEVEPVLERILVERAELLYRLGTDWTG